MLLEGVRNLFRLHASAVVAAPTVAASAPLLKSVPASLPDDDDPLWSSARIAVADSLWGEGFQFPGGEAETLRLAKPLGLSQASSLLLAGCGLGGPARCIAAELGVWVSGFEANTRLATIGAERSAKAGLGRRAQVEAWNPRAPKFPHHYYHHGMSLQALRGNPAEPVLGAISQALKPGGHLVVVELVADRPLDPADSVVSRWGVLEDRPALAPHELELTKLLSRLGFDVRIVEDISQRHMHQALEGWQAVLETVETARSDLPHVATLVREAELWLLRCRLLRLGQLRLVRWHAIGRGGVEV